MARLAIIGSSDLATLIAHHARLLDWEIAGFIDNRASVGSLVAPYGNVLGGIDDVERLHGEGLFDALSVGVGYLQFAYRAEAFERFKGRLPFASIIHRSVVIDADCAIGEGVVILPGCVLDTGVTLGDNVLLNAGVVIAHHSAIRAHSFVGPAAKIAGKVRVGEQCFVGVNATVIDNITVCDGAKIGGGAVVIRDVESTDWQLGVPARARA